MSGSSAWELVRFLQKQRERDELMDHGTNFPGIAACIKPRCWRCKKEVDETLETVAPDGTHHIVVKCHGDAEGMRITRSELHAMMMSKFTMSAGYAFMPKRKGIMNQKKITKEKIKHAHHAA